eukprot:Phypoly_transcript_20367.p1 GENE.Phypoly_transcript_20367~~Phypoly_transcript_20367.p1  ORF type:complete len:193 (+),score=14.77 Phypoly_transcript_20367:72-650(+)
MSYKPEDPLVPPGYQAQAVQPPTYNVLPNGQTQMIYTMPAGFAPPSYQYPYPAQVYGQPSQPQYVQYAPAQQQCTKSGNDGFYTATLVTYIIGLFAFFPHLVSLILSFVMVSKGYVHGARKAVVITMAIFELFAWLFCASFSWFFVNDCNYYGCYVMYWGWIAIVIWFVVALSCGIPRVIFLKNHSVQYQHM